MVTELGRRAGGPYALDRLQDELERYWCEHRTAPTLRYLAVGTGTCVSVVHHRLARLVAEGRVERVGEDEVARYVPSLAQCRRLSELWR